MNTIAQRIRYLILALLCCTGVHSFSQDSLRLTLADAESRFLQNNLTLLAEKYNIDIARAMVIQARLYNNPNLALEGNLYNPQEKKFFNWGQQGQGEFAFALNQVIIMAGKRNKQIQMAQTGVKQSEQQFYDLLRTLRYTLRGDFYNLYYLQHSYASYQQQIIALEKLNDAYQLLLNNGVAPLKDAVRIQSLLYSLQAELTDLQSNINDVQAEMQLLLHSNKTSFIIVNDKDARVPLPAQLNLQQLIDTAYANRADLQLQQSNLLYSQQNYRLQKAMAVPDLTVGGSFDRNGNYIRNYSSLNLAMDLPFFNRNQGNIKAAKIAIDQNKTQVELQASTVENEVQTAYIKALNADKALQKINPTFNSNFEKLLNSVLENFQKKVISLVEFIDFYDAYRSNVLQMNQLQYNKMQAIETLNFSVGKTIINP